MSEKANQAVELFKEGYVCSQAVLATYSEQFGLERKMALKIADGFGAGIARKQEICGTVSGAIMLIGLKYGKFEPDDNEAHEKTYERIQYFCKRFTEMNGSITCRELLGCDMQTANEKGLFSILCKKFIEDATNLVEEILAE